MHCLHHLAPGMQGQEPCPHEDMLVVSVKLQPNVSKGARSVFTPDELHDSQTCSIHRPYKGAQNIVLGGQRCFLHMLISSHCLYLLQHHCHRSTAVVCDTLQTATTRLAYMPQQCACTEAPCHPSLQCTALHWPMLRHSDSEGWWSLQVGAKLLLDCCQSVPCRPTNVQQLGADWIVGAGHKMCGPTGSAFLWGK